MVEKSLDRLSLVMIERCMVWTIADWHKEYFPMVFRRCKYMLRKNAYDPEDAAQDVFLNLLKYKEMGKEVKDVKNVEGLLWTITTNVCLNLLKAKKWKPGEDFLFNGEEIISASGDDYKLIDEKLSVQAVLEDESEELKCYFYMYYYDGIGYAEIAEAVGRSKSWVGKTLNAFREKARKKLGEKMT